MRRSPESHDQLMRGLRESANRSRDTADEMAAMWEGCDDPLHPLMGYDPQPFRDWIDFVERVARPVVEAEDEATVQAAMRLYRQANPHFICACLYMAATRAAPPAPPEEQPLRPTNKENI